MIILNGLGCTLSGGHLVLQELIDAFPHDQRLHVIAPKGKNLQKYNSSGNISIHYLNHNIWKGVLRLLPEFFINILLYIKLADLCFNISNYGLCLNKNQVLYIQNQYMVDLSYNSIGMKIKRIMMNTYLKRAKYICVQTNHMITQLKTYSAEKNIKIDNARIKKLSPLPSIPSSLSKSKTEKKYKFEFFYPASTFIHKHADIAIHSMNGKKDIGLSITVDPIDEKSRTNINYLGVVNHLSVVEEFSKADALLFTSSRESLGLPLLEALAFEIPAVLPDMEYAREIYADAAVYYSENTVESVSVAIDKLVDDYSFYKRLAIQRKSIEWNTRMTWREHWTEILG